MTLPIEMWLPLLGISIGAGCVGALLGLGGGFIIVPALTLVFGVDLRSAIGAALVAVIATSSGSSVTYLKQSYANLELAAFLEISTVLGAVCAVFIAGYVSPSFLYFSFSILLVFSSLMMIHKNASGSATTLEQAPGPKVISRGFPRIQGTSLDQTGHAFEYSVKHPWVGFGISGIAGLLSGLLGIGGGVIKVPTMNVIMGVPIKSASATSNLMVGMTAATSAILMLARQEIPLQISAIVSMGVYLGARFGSTRLMTSSNRTLSWVFLAFAWLMAFQMFTKGLNS